MSSTLVGPIHGMGFVLGVARGKLTREAATTGILLADHRILRSMTFLPAGCVLVDAAPFSHASIALLSRGIPTVMVGAEETSQLREGLEVVLDGASVQALSEPGSDERDVAHSRLWQCSVQVPNSVSQRSSAICRAAPQSLAEVLRQLACTPIHSASCDTSPKNILLESDMQDS